MDAITSTVITLPKGVAASTGGHFKVEWSNAFGVASTLECLGCAGGFWPLIKGDLLCGQCAFVCKRCEKRNRRGSLQPRSVEAKTAVRMGGSDAAIELGVKGHWCCNICKHGNYEQKESQRKLWKERRRQGIR